MANVTVVQALDIARRHHTAGDLRQAEIGYRQVLTQDPRNPGALHLLGLLAHQVGHRDTAVGLLRQSVAIRPEPAALNDLGVVCHASHQLDEAGDVFREAIRLAPAIPEIHNNLGNVLQDVGRPAAAIACFREAVRLRRDFAVAHSNLLYAMHFDPACDPAALLAEHRNWARIHAEPLTAAAKPHVSDISPGKRLRIGYVSGDLHDHPVGRFLLPILEAHDRKRFEIVCYYDGNAADGVNQRLRAASTAWHATRELIDAQLADLIRGHGIDVLFDLAAHAPGNRLLVFARKAAPVQITYLGYPGTTGMSAMDARITDPYLDPPGASEALYAERSVRPASNYWCYSPITDAPDVGELPALRNGHVTFGCLNNFAKTNPLLLQTWCGLLDGVPGSRLLLHAHPGRHREDVREVFKSHRVDPARLEFVGTQATRRYLETYSRIDFALDPFPYNGGTTTCDALWMGVPVVSLAGQLAVHRAGVSLLNNVGLPELIAHDPDQYARIAVDSVNNLPRLGDIRRTLRDAMRRSPLCDAAAFTRRLETALEQIWQERGERATCGGN